MVLEFRSYAQKNSVSKKIADNLGERESAWAKKHAHPTPPQTLIKWKKLCSMCPASTLIKKGVDLISIII